MKERMERRRGKRGKGIGAQRPNDPNFGHYNREKNILFMELVVFLWNRAKQKIAQLKRTDN